MSQDEIDKNFNFENNKHTEFFLPFYREKNWIVIQDNVGKGNFTWDVKLEIYVGQCVTVDEKALRNPSDNFLVELIQDMCSGNIGWFFGEKDWILYSMWNEDKLDALYLVKMKELKEYIYSFSGVISLPICISTKGWGITWNIILKWQELIDKNIAKKLI